MALPAAKAVNPLGSVLDAATGIIGWPVMMIFVGVVLLLIVLRLWLAESKPGKKPRRRRRSQRRNPETPSTGRKPHPFEKPLDPEPDPEPLPEYVSDREPEPWEKLTQRQMVSILSRAQKNEKGFVTCAGCGVTLETEFMELDHINPKSSSGPDTIDNRVLLCRPCNRIKGQRYTLPGLWQENTRRRRMRNPDKARRAKQEAWTASQKAKEGYKTTMPRTTTLTREETHLRSMTGHPGDRPDHRERNLHPFHPGRHPGLEQARNPSCSGK